MKYNMASLFFNFERLSQIKLNFQGSTGAGLFKYV